jgi:hypothetical protein
MMNWFKSGEAVIPAKAGIQHKISIMDSRLRGNDGVASGGTL